MVNSLGHEKHAHNRYEGLQCYHILYSIEVVYVELWVLDVRGNPSWN
jgi:hypothetical protein